MNNLLATIRDGLRRVRKVWIISAVVILGLVIGLASFASGSFDKAFAAFQGKSAVSGVNVQAMLTPTMAAMPGMGETPTAMPPMPGMGETPTAMAGMPGMELPTQAPANGQPAAGDDMGALLNQMQQNMQSLQGMMGQLEQRSAANTLPAATPTAAAPTIDLQPFMVELQDINRTMVPLIQRIQADLQGNPSAEELASVRAQVAQIQERMVNLMNNLQSARGGTSPVAQAPTTAAMPGMGSMPGMSNMQPTAVGQMGQTEAMKKLEELMQHMQVMLQQMQSQQQAGNMSGGSMSGGSMSGGSMSSQSGQMGSMMTMMDDMMSMMDDMMGMGGTSSQSGQMNGMNMATATPMPGMSNSSSGAMMDDMMMMMDNMMMMMDNMMKMDMMGMPDM